MTAEFERMTTACPECDSAWIEVRNPTRLCSRATTDARYRCRDCKARFNEPRERARDSNNHGAPRNGLAAELHAADPEDCTGGDDR